MDNKAITALAREYAEDIQIMQVRGLFAAQGLQMQGIFQMIKL